MNITTAAEWMIAEVKSGNIPDVTHGSVNVDEAMLVAAYAANHEGVDLTLNDDNGADDGPVWTAASIAAQSLEAEMRRDDFDDAYDRAIARGWPD